VIVPTEAFSWPAIDLISNGVQVLLAVNGQVRALGQMLANQAVHVLVGASLPWTVGGAEVQREADAYSTSCAWSSPVLGHRSCSAAQQLVREGERLQHVCGTGRLDLAA
jgi:hypothetical protein